MPKAYSDDLRWRVVWLKLFLNKSDEEIALQLFVCPKTMSWIFDIFLATGDVSPKQIGRPKGTTTLYPHEEYVIVDTILRNPTIQLAELGRDIERNFATHFSCQSICSAVY